MGGWEKARRFYLFWFLWVKEWFDWHVGGIKSGSSRRLGGGFRVGRRQLNVCLGVKCGSPESSGHSLNVYVIKWSDGDPFCARVGGWPIVMIQYYKASSLLLDGAHQKLPSRKICFDLIWLRAVYCLSNLQYGQDCCLLLFDSPTLYDKQWCLEFSNSPYQPQIFFTWFMAQCVIVKNFFLFWILSHFK